jgi:hypothetical protein
MSSEHRKGRVAMACRADRMYFWLQRGEVDTRAVHVGAVDNGAPAPRLHCAPRFCSANVLGPGGYGLEFVHRSWQHGHALATKGARHDG